MEGKRWKISARDGDGDGDGDSGDERRRCRRESGIGDTRRRVWESMYIAGIARGKYGVEGVLKITGPGCAMKYDVWPQA